MYVYERDLLHPVPDSELRVEALIAGLPVQLSEAVALPTDGNVEGLHPTLEEAGQDVNVGPVVSNV